jgi:hypothetical protein
MALPFLKRIADSTDELSLAARFRRGRLHLFQTLLDQLPRPVTILDVGGTQQFWEQAGFTGGESVQITLLNLTPVTVTRPNFQSVSGDGRDLSQFAGQQFDIVFSNSVIEHLATRQDQQLMALAVKRVGKRYFIQTPNKYFPLEPHFLWPFFQFYPVWLRAQLLHHFDLGWVKRLPDYEAAKREVQQIRLLSRAEFRQLFPDGHLVEEKIFGLSKSFVIYHGWDVPAKPLSFGP